MTIPIYDITTLPAIIYPFDNSQAEAEIYLGNRAVTGYMKGGISIKCRNNADMKLLETFWRDTCNNGLEPFLIPLPFFGTEPDDPDLPELLVMFEGDFEFQAGGQIWNGDIGIVVLGTIDYIINDLGDFIVADTGEYTVTAGGDYEPTGNEKQYREVFYREVLYGN